MVDTDDTRQTIHDGLRTTPRVWHKLPTGELKITAMMGHNFCIVKSICKAMVTHCQIQTCDDTLPLHSIMEIRASTSLTTLF